MHYMEYGKEHKEVIVLLHGGGLSWWNYREVGAKLSSDYHVFLPILDGHAESSCDFTSIEKNAARIIAFIDEQFGGSVLLIGGLSLGGQIVLEILSQRKDICQYALIESALVVPSKFTYAMIKPAFGSCHGLIKHRWFSKLQFRSLRMPQALFEDYYRDTAKITKSNMIAFLKANTVYRIKPALKNSQAQIRVVVGGKEQRPMIRSAKKLHKILPGSSLEIKDGLLKGVEMQKDVPLRIQVKLDYTDYCSMEVSAYAD